MLSHNSSNGERLSSVIDGVGTALMDSEFRPDGTVACMEKLIFPRKVFYENEYRVLAAGGSPLLEMAPPYVQNFRKAVESYVMLLRALQDCDACVSTFFTHHRPPEGWQFFIGLGRRAQWDAGQITPIHLVVKRHCAHPNRTGYITDVLLQ